MKLKYIDALRGIAILAVIIVHTGQCGTNNYPGIVKTIIGHGAMGVQLFYLASAFTLFLSYNYRKGSEINPKRNFFIRRFFRIAPMYYLGIIYYLFQNGFGPRYWLGDAQGITLGNIISNITFTHGVNPYWINSLVPGGWSITVEMTFYAIVPFLFKKISSTNQAVNFTILSLVFSIILRFILFRFPIISDEVLWNNYLLLYFPNQIALFGLGITAYFMIIKNDKKVTAFNYLIISALLIAHIIWSFIPVHFLFGLAFLTLISSLSKHENPLLVNKLTIFLGKISYSAYLVHFAVLYWLTQFEYVDFIRTQGEITGLLNYLFRLILVVVITSIISMALLKFIEQPFQKIGKKIIVKLEQTNIIVYN